MIRIASSSTTPRKVNSHPTQNQRISLEFYDRAVKGHSDRSFYTFPIYNRKGRALNRASLCQHGLPTWWNE